MKENQGLDVITVCCRWVCPSSHIHEFTELMKQFGGDMLGVRLISIFGEIARS